MYHSSHDCCAGGAKVTLCAFKALWAEVPESIKNRCALRRLILLATTIGKYRHAQVHTYGAVRHIGWHPMANTASSYLQRKTFRRSLFLCSMTMMDWFSKKFSPKESRRCRSFHASEPCWEEDKARQAKNSYVRQRSIFVPSCQIKMGASTFYGIDSMDLSQTRRNEGTPGPCLCRRCVSKWRRHVLGHRTNRCKLLNGTRRQCSQLKDHRLRKQRQDR